jgi:hypothetical protein
MMNTCKFNDFIQMLKPWLNDDYIREVGLGNEGNVTLWFVDGGYQTYQIDDCSSVQLENTIEQMKKHGIQVIR